MQWKTNNEQLEREFTFSNFKQALRFVNKVGELAEEMDHHPDILLFGYKKVKITLTTHSEGKITELDYGLAEKIDQIKI
ncbi:MAG: 4a-hydroxytetrahydrobiopterin dehydratase [Prolixibacteraceae bacterium]